MKRNKKLLRNTLIIFIILFTYCFFYGFYLSKDKCIDDNLRSLYVTGRQRVMEFVNKNLCVTLIIDEETETFSLISTKKYGFLYHVGSCTTNTSYVGEEIIDVNGMYDEKMGMCIVVNRVNENVSYVEACFEDSTIMILSDWQKNFVGFLLDCNEWQKATYKAYDKNDQLLSEFTY